MALRDAGNEFGDRWLLHAPSVAFSARIGSHPDQEPREENRRPAQPRGTEAAPVNALTQGTRGYAPHIVVVDERAFANVTGDVLGKAFASTDETYGYALLADSRSMTDALSGCEITLDYVDLSVSDPEDAELFNSFIGRVFRCAITEIASIEANLSIANMDFHDFGDNTDPDGVFAASGTTTDQSCVPRLVPAIDRHPEFDQVQGSGGTSGSAADSARTCR